MVIIKKGKVTTNTGENVEKSEHSYTIGRNVKWYSHWGQQSGSSSKG